MSNCSVYYFFEEGSHHVTQASFRSMMLLPSKHWGICYHTQHLLNFLSDSMSVCLSVCGLEGFLMRSPIYDLKPHITPIPDPRRPDGISFQTVSMPPLFSLFFTFFSSPFLSHAPSPSCFLPVALNPWAVSVGWLLTGRSRLSSHCCHHLHWGLDWPLCLPWTHFPSVKRFIKICALQLVCKGAMLLHRLELTFTN